MRRVGIDEAGRGCVIGSLWVCAFAVDVPADDALLRRLGARDSKAIDEAKRRVAVERLRTVGTFHVVECTAAELDAGNVNHVEEAAIVGLLRDLVPDAVAIDALGPPAALERICARLAKEGRCKAPIVMQPKADRDLPVVGAASLMAKLSRDDALVPLRAAWGDFGSGYPSDPVTRRWMADHAASGQPWPPFVRTKWATVRDLEAGR